MRGRELRSGIKEGKEGEVSRNKGKGKGGGRGGGRGRQIQYTWSP